NLRAGIGEEGPSERDRVVPDRPGPLGDRPHERLHLRVPLEVDVAVVEDLASDEGAGKEEDHEAGQECRCAERAHAHASGIAIQRCACSGWYHAGLTWPPCLATIPRTRGPERFGHRRDHPGALRIFTAAGEASLGHTGEALDPTGARARRPVAPRGA